MYLFWIAAAFGAGGELGVLRAEAGLMLDKGAAQLETWEQSALAEPDSLRAYLVRVEIAERRGQALPGVPEGLEQLQGAAEALDAGKPKLALSRIGSGGGAQGAALRLRALADLGASRPLYREARRFRSDHPNRVDDLYVLWRASSRRLGHLREGVLESAAHALAGDDLELLYRAWRLFISIGQENLAEAAGARIGRLEDRTALPGRLAWGPAMIRDLSRALFRSPDPVLPTSASLQEQIAIWAELSRLALVAGETEKASVFSGRSVALGGGVPEGVELPGVSRISVATSQGRIEFGGDTQRSVVVNLWASWCGPCKKELPELERMARRFAEEGIDLPVLAISMDEHRSDYERYLRANPFSAVAMAWVPGLKNELGGEVLPTTYYIDSEGKIRLKREGYKTGETERLEALVRGHLE